MYPLNNKQRRYAYELTPVKRFLLYLVEEEVTQWNPGIKGDGIGVHL